MDVLIIAREIGSCAQILTFVARDFMIVLMPCSNQQS